MPLKIGTRGSPLALAQACTTRDLLGAVHPELAEDDAIEMVTLKTMGDRVQNRYLSEVGGKGAFTRELDEALFDGRIDLAVHSMKDVPTQLPAGIVLTAILERDDVRDVFVSHKADRFEDLPEGSVVGTSSLRRQSQILARHPHLQAALFRGNVETRLRKLEDGEVAATMLALAGLKRLKMTQVATRVLEPDDMLPAAGQGAIGITCLETDKPTRALLATLNHERTSLCVSAERAMLDVLDGSCRTPIAGLAELFDNRANNRATIRIRGLLAWPDGSDLWAGERSGPASDAMAMARDLGAELRDRAGAAFFEALAD